MFFINPPANGKIPKEARNGDILSGVLKLGKTAAREYALVFSVPPEGTSDKKGDKDGSAAAAAAAAEKEDEKAVSEKYKNEVRDLKIKWLATLLEKGTTIFGASTWQTSFFSRQRRGI